MAAAPGPGPAGLRGRALEGPRPLHDVLGLAPAPADPVAPRPRLLALVEPPVGLVQLLGLGLHLAPCRLLESILESLDGVRGLLLPLLLLGGPHHQPALVGVAAGERAGRFCFVLLKSFMISFLSFIVIIIIRQSHATADKITRQQLTLYFRYSRDLRGQ